MRRCRRWARRQPHRWPVVHRRPQRQDDAGARRVVNHDAVPAACFTHPEIAMVGPTEEQAREKAEAEGYEISVSTGNFRANSNALAEGEADGIAKVIFRKDTTEVIACHIVGLHA